MNYQEVVDLMNLRFTSGNSCPIDRASIKVEEWEIMKNAIESAVSEEHEYCAKLAEHHAKYYSDKSLLPENQNISNELVIIASAIRELVDAIRNRYEIK